MAHQMKEIYLALAVLCCCTLVLRTVALPADDSESAHAQQQSSVQQQQDAYDQQQQQQQLASGAGVVEGRKTYNKNTNSLKMSGLDKKQSQTTEEISPASILTRLDWRSLFTTAMKMFFGNGDDQSKQASKQLVQMVISLIDGLRLSFTMRKAQARSSGGDDGTPTADAALAALSMLKTYVKTITSKNSQCAKKYLCQGNREAVRDGNKIGYIIAQAISYANSYVLENIQATTFEDNFNAGKEGRNGANCEEVFNSCNEI